MPLKPNYIFSLSHAYDMLIISFSQINIADIEVFSLNFSSAGNGPFMDGKAKNIYFSKRGGGGAVE